MLNSASASVPPGRAHLSVSGNKPRVPRQHKPSLLVKFPRKGGELGTGHDRLLLNVNIMAEDTEVLIIKPQGPSNGTSGSLRQAPARNGLPYDGIVCGWMPDPQKAGRPTGRAGGQN